MHLYSSKDFYLCAYLIGKGYQLQDHFREGSRTIFQFEKSSILKELVSSYYAGTAMVEPIKYGASIRNLKNILHDVYSEANTNEVNQNEKSFTRRGEKL